MVARGMKHTRERAVAIQYEDVNSLPRILATGAGEIARQIIRIARQNGIPVQQDSDLSEMLAKLNLGSVISEESYRLVAEILCFLYLNDTKWREEHQELAPIIEPTLGE